MRETHARCVRLGRAAVRCENVKRENINVRQTMSDECTKVSGETEKS